MKGAHSNLTLEAATVCERGLVRPENQDSVLSDVPGRFFAVADGMGGGQGGARASALVVEALKREMRRADDFAERVEALRRSVGVANDSIRDFAREKGYHQTGSTLAAILLGDELPGPSLLAWIGDSRVYRLRAGKLQLLTRDHTVANELFGALASRDGSYDRTLPYAHVLTRALGTEPSISADWRRCEIGPGDRLLVCSDGIHDMLSGEKLGAILTAAPSAEEGIAALSKAVCEAGAVDNFTAVLVFVKEGA